MYHEMKTLISIITLLAIVSAYIFSASLYVQGELLAAYSLVIASIAGVTLWIRQHDLFRIH
jgi:hypothetical protein